MGLGGRREFNLPRRPPNFSAWTFYFFGELPTVNQADFHHEARMTPSSVPQLQAHSGNFAARKMKRTFRSPLGKPECLLHRATLPHRCLRSSLACWDITSKASCPHWQQWLAHSCHYGQIQEKTLRCLHTAVALTLPLYTAKCMAEAPLESFSSASAPAKSRSREA